MSNPTEIFGSMVFNDEVMREKLPKEIYKTLKTNIKNNQPLERSGKRGGHGHEGLGRAKGRYTLYTLVSAYDRHNRRKA